MLKSNEPQLLSIEAIVQKASFRQQFEEIPADIKKLFLEKMSSNEMQSKINERKKSKFYVNKINFNNPVEDKKIPPLPHHKIKSKSLNTSKTCQQTERNPQKREEKNRGYRKSLESNNIQVELGKEKKQQKRSGLEKEQKKILNRFEYEFQFPFDKYQQKRIQQEKRSKIVELRKTDQNKSQDRISSQPNIHLFKKSQQRKSEVEKIPDFIMNKLPVTHVNAIQDQPKMKTSHLQFTEESILQQGEKRVIKAPKLTQNGKQKILKKPKTADSSEDLQPKIKFIRLQKKQKNKTIYLKSSENVGTEKRRNRSQKGMRKHRQKEQVVCGWEVSENPIFPQYY